MSDNRGIEIVIVPVHGLHHVPIESPKIVRDAFLKTLPISARSRDVLRQGCRHYISDAHATNMLDTAIYELQTYDITVESIYEDVYITTQTLLEHIESVIRCNVLIHLDYMYIDAVLSDAVAVRISPCQMK